MSFSTLQVYGMSSSDLGMMIISLIGIFGLASFLFEKLSANHSKRKKGRQ